MNRSDVEKSSQKITAEPVELCSLLRKAGYPFDAAMEGIRISSVTADSRKVEPGSLFVAVAGSQADGHAFIEQALAGGSIAVVVQDKAHLPKRTKAVVISVPDSHAALGKLAAAFYDNPASRLIMIGITGTNGKTTTSYLVEGLLRTAGAKPGVLGTVNYRYADRIVPAALTTPGSEELHRLLRHMVDSGVTHVVMEVSSHALQQGRLAGLQFDIAAFTNLSRDHLDYHHSMKQYYASKLLLFSKYLRPGGKAVVVAGGNGTECGTEEKRDWAMRLTKDIERATALKSGNRAEVITCGDAGEIRPRQLAVDLTGIHGGILTPAGEFDLHSPLVGSFNVDNLLCAAGIGLGLEIGPQIIGPALSGVPGVPGRLERVVTSKKIDVFVDYAHTPDAMENVLVTLRRLSRARLLVVFGCGGDRDVGKRSVMGEIAARLADGVLITSDNPRSEDPTAIIAEIEKGVVGLPIRRQRAEVFLMNGLRGCYDVISDRRLAIRTAVLFSSPGDVVLLAGKGHEDYQMVCGRKIFLDDRLEARACLQQWQAADQGGNMVLRGGGQR
ncbi:MAG: UDP-N-acetylmuramoyl-L-alanyl-D-glutamate--2,6-diaminopimelate ligase [Deltaproteobacteria bacterium]